jgi:1-acyl-sn-glycerol-3-phosphate acyltransferase
MKIAILGKDGPLAHATRELAMRRGHQCASGECAIYFPGGSEELQHIVERGAYSRVILRSHAFAYGSSTKNPGLMTEERLSLLPPDAPEQAWLRMETIAARHQSCAAVRLANVLAADEDSLAVKRIASRWAISLAGHDPNLQFIGVEDAAEVLIAAAESSSNGLFNAAAPGAVPLKEAIRAAGCRRVPLPRPVAQMLDREASASQLQYNWTVSSQAAERELGWRPSESTPQALLRFLQSKPGSRSGLLGEAYDDYGLDEEYIRAWGAWFWFLRNVYWRIEHEGMENIPAAGRGLFVSNHRGFMPLDAVMHVSLILAHRRRIPRFLIIHTLLRVPFLCNFLTKLGGVIASQENAARLLADENLVGIFPEGIRGAFTPYKSAYRLRDFSKSGFARIAIENQTPVIPSAVVGHAEIFPILGRIDWSYLTREWGWPYLPIAPMFPLAPIPLPSKWHVRVLEPVPLEGLKPSDADNRRIVTEFSAHIQNLVQQNIDEMCARRRHIFWGRLSQTSAAGPSLPLTVPYSSEHKP